MAIGTSIDITGFEPCSKDEINNGSLEKLVRDFYSSGHECVRKKYTDENDASKARGCIASTISRLKLPVKVHRRKLTIYMERVDTGDTND